MSTSGSRNRLGGDWRSAAWLALAIAAFFWPFLAQKSVFYQVDLAFMDHPLRAHAFQHLRAGDFPFWCEHLLSGFPLFAEGQAALLYPPSWLYLVLPGEAALNLFVVLHYAILGASTYLFLRSRLSPESSLLGSLTLAFSSFCLAMHVLPGFLSVIAWTPLLLWSGERFLESGSTRCLALGALLIAGMHLAGDPLGVLISASLYGAYVLLGATSATRHEWRRRWAALAVPLALGTLLAAVQLWPTREFLEESTRGQSRAAGPPLDNFVPAAVGLTAWLPNFHGSRFSDYSGPQPPVWEESLLFFTGFSTLLLLPFGLIRERRELFWAGAGLAALALSSRELQALAGVAWTWPPLVLFRWPAHTLLWYAMASAALSARGLEEVLERSDVRRTSVRLAAAALLVGAGFTAALRQPWPAPGTPLAAARRADAMALGASLLVAALALTPAGRRALGRRGRAATFLGLLGLGLLRSPAPEGLPAGSFSRAAAQAAELGPLLGPGGRLLALRAWDQPERPQEASSFQRTARAVPANLHLLAGLAAVGQFDLAHTTTLWRSQAALARPGTRVLELLGVDVLIGVPEPQAGSEASLLLERARARGYSTCREGPPAVLCRDQRLSRAFLAREYQVRTAGQALTALDSESGPSPREHLVLEQEPSWPAPGGAAGADQDRVELVSSSSTRVELEVWARADAVLVLADACSAAWRARLDQREVPILPAHGLVRAVAVPAGRHRVVFRYEARAFRIGLAASLCGALVLLWLLVRRGRTE